MSEYELLPLDESGDRYAFRRHAGQPWQLATFGRLTDGTSYVFADGLMSRRCIKASCRQVDPLQDSAFSNNGPSETRCKELENDTQ